jgi:hypothetical protein
MVVRVDSPPTLFYGRRIDVKVMAGLGQVDRKLIVNFPNSFLPPVSELYIEI